jgi:hypothetical protein
MIKTNQSKNKSLEETFLNQKFEEKSKDINPWKKVIRNIDLRQSDYKGSKDVGRMREVILGRKNDYYKDNKK